MTVKLFPKNKRKIYRIWYTSIKQLYQTAELWSNKAIVFADKTSSIYKLDNVGYEQGGQWLQKEVQKEAQGLNLKTTYAFNCV